MPRPKYRVTCREWVEWVEIVEADSIDEAEAAACEQVASRGHRVRIRDVYEVVKTERVRKDTLFDVIPVEEGAEGLFWVKVTKPGRVEPYYMMEEDMSRTQFSRDQADAMVAALKVGHDLGVSDGRA